MSVFLSTTQTAGSGTHHLVLICLPVSHWSFSETFGQGDAHRRHSVQVELGGNRQDGGNSTFFLLLLSRAVVVIVD